MHVYNMRYKNGTKNNDTNNKVKYYQILGTTRPFFKTKTKHHIGRKKTSSKVAQNVNLNEMNTLDLNVATTICIKKSKTRKIKPTSDAANGLLGSAER